MTEPHRPEPTALRQWLIGCSPSRTLVARRADGDRTLLVKVYESGSPAEASRELALGQRLAGPGVARHLDTGVDPETGKPCLIQELVPGTSLDTLLDQAGALSARRAAMIARGLAGILARFAEFRDPHAPAGFVHADVKPGNVMVDEPEDGPPVVTLLDLESAIEAPVGHGTCAPGFTGGTHGFAPAEAYDGACPTPEFDVFGLGATLHAMLAGAAPFGEPGASETAIGAAVVGSRRRRWLLGGCPAPLRAIVEDCLEQDPAERPTARGVSDRLAAWLERPTEDDARMLALSGRPLSALAAQTDPEDSAWRGRLARRDRLVDRLGTPPAPDPDAPIDELANRLPSTLEQLDAFLLRFPLHPEARAARRRAVEGTARLIGQLPEQVATLKRRARFEQAMALCDATERAIGRAGGLPRSDAGGRRPTAAERDPLRVVAVVRRDLDAAARAHDEVQERIRDAVADGDPSAVEAAITALANLYGGASPVVAAAKDRLHRFDFYLAHVGQQAALVDELATLLAELGLEFDLAPLQRLRRGDATRSPARPRALLRALDDLTDEFTAIAPRVEPAREVLAASLDAATRRGWEIVAEIERMLETPPIPIRPLTGLVARLDSMLQLDVLVDRPGQSRHELHDQIEAVRVKIEQARSERDRITQGAQEAMDRGHLTTAIYDMSRAVDRFDSEDSDGAGLAEQFEEAKRRKREIEDALAHNHELAARYGDLAADPTSLPAERLVVLHEREHLLSLLCANLGPDRASVYAEDLRGVQLDVLREQSAEGARRLGTARDPRERLAIAQRTFDALQQAAPDAGWNEREAQDARAILREWLEHAEEATRAVREQPSPRARIEGGRRRIGPLGIAGIAASLIAVTVTAVLLGRGDTSDPVPALRAALDHEIALRTADGAEPDFDATRALAQLRDFVAELRKTEPEAAEAARRTTDAIDAVNRGASRFDAVEDTVTALAAATERLSDERVSNLIARFSGRALRAGFVAAVLRDPSAELRRHLEEDSALRRALSAEDADALGQLLAR